MSMKKPTLPHRHVNFDADMGESFGLWQTLAAAQIEVRPCPTIAAG
ncbi:MAG: hypothetical protein K2R98_11520 [Gemmataceae bacterium]|nr:hypothetical protein [Gemmataceae bacterium]